MSYLNLISLVGWPTLCLLAWVVGGCKRPVPWRTVVGSAILTFGLGALAILGDTALIEAAREDALVSQGQERGGPRG